jgi:hypothetical protein
LRKHKNSLPEVTDKRLSFRGKRKIIEQKGDFLLPLLSAVLPTLAVVVIMAMWLAMLRKIYVASQNTSIKAKSSRNLLLQIPLRRNLQKRVISLTGV